MRESGSSAALLTTVGLALVGVVGVVAASMVSDAGSRSVAASFVLGFPLAASPIAGTLVAY